MSRSKFLLSACPYSERGSLSGWRRGFSLLELMVVVTLILVLLALLAPSLTSARQQAHLIQCKANLRSVYQSAVTYVADHKADPGRHEQDHIVPELFWRFDNASEDAPHESGHRNQPGNPARALYRNGYLKDPGVFFCPLVPIGVDTHFNPDAPSDFKSFWGTYAWRWHKVRRAEDGHANFSSNRIQYANDASKDVVMTDGFASYWSDVGTPYRVEHYNAVFIDGRVEEVGDEERAFRFWLYGEALVPYGTYPL